MDKRKAEIAAAMAGFARDPFTEEEYLIARQCAKGDPSGNGIRIFIDDNGGWHWGYTALGPTSVPVGDEEGPFRTRLGALTAVLVKLVK